MSGAGQSVPGWDAPMGLDLRGARLPGLPPVEGAPDGPGGESDGAAVRNAPLRLCRRRALTAAQARALNALLRRRAPVTLRAGARQAALHLRARPLPSQGAPWLALRIDGAAAAVALPWSLLRRLTGMPLEAARPDDAALLAEDALSGWLDAAERATGLALQFDRLTAEPDAAALPLDLMLGVETLLPERTRHRLALRLSSEAARRLAEALGRWMRPREALPGLCLRAAIELDGVFLPLTELRGLRVGDAVMLPEDPGPRGMRVVIEDRLTAPVAPDGAGLWRLTAPLVPRVAGLRAGVAAPAALSAAASALAGSLPLSAANAVPGNAVPVPAPPRLSEIKEMTQTDPTRPAAPDPAPDPGPASAPASPPDAAPGDGGGAAVAQGPVQGPVLGALDELELRLSFRLGEALVSLAELRAAGVGSVISLDRPDGAPVDIVLNGQVIGTGQVISVAGQRACEIVTLFGDG